MKTKNKSFTLKILKKDLQTAKYVNPTDCPIARAVKRRGGNFDILGFGVDCGSLDFSYKGERFNISTKKYQNLSDRVHNMMRYGKKRKTFSIKLNAKVVK